MAKALGRLVTVDLERTPMDMQTYHVALEVLRKTSSILPKTRSIDMFQFIRTVSSRLQMKLPDEGILFGWGLLTMNGSIYMINLTSC